MKLSVICPVYNEEKYITKILDFFVNSLPLEKELIVIDGQSDDRTREIVSEYVVKYDNIRLIDNPKRFVPHALNIAIKESKGNPVVRLDAHTEYDSDYLIQIQLLFQRHFC